MTIKNAGILIALTLAFFLTGCSGSKPVPNATKGDLFPLMYEEQPRSILILPPINESTDAEAKDFYMTTVETPFALKGYYVFPTEMVSEILKQEGIQDASTLTSMPANKFNDYFGADSVLFITIHKWDTSYAVLASTLKVAISARLVSTKTNQVLWRNAQNIVVDLGGGGSSSLEGLLISAVITAVSTASADYVTYARQVNNKLVSSLPAGPYSPNYMQDESMPAR